MRNFHQKLNGPLFNNKATKYEIEKELADEADVKLFDTEWDTLPTDIRKEQLDEELETYHKNFQENLNQLNEKIKDLEEDLSFDYKKNEDSLTSKQYIQNEQDIVDQIKIDYMKNGSLRVPIARPAVPVFGRPMKFKKSI